VRCLKPERAAMLAAMPDAPATGIERDAPEALPPSPIPTILQASASRGARKGPCRPMPSRPLRELFAFALAALLAGCTGAASPPLVASAGAETTAELPLAALQVGDDLFQEPIGHDAEGCLMYRLFSPTTLTTHAISYRSIEGGFTLKRRLALCTPGA
jgi:hypothetical protein